MTKMNDAELAEINAEGSRPLTRAESQAVEQHIEDCCEGATVLHAYLGARAKAEGVPYDLDEDYLVSHLLDGVRSFFGVSIDLEQLTLSDVQQPRRGFLTRWLKQYRNS